MWPPLKYFIILHIFRISIMKIGVILFFLAAGVVMGFLACMVLVEPVTDEAFTSLPAQVAYPPIDPDAPLGVGLHTGRPAPAFVVGEQSRDNYVLAAMLPLPDNGAQLAIIQWRRQTLPEIPEAEPRRDLAGQMHIAHLETAGAIVGESESADGAFLLTQNIYRLYPMNREQPLPALGAGNFLNLPKPLYVNFAPLKAGGGTFK